MPAQMDESCEDQWTYAREICEEWFDSPDRHRGLEGYNMDQCMRGQVSADCGGNPF